MNSRARRPLVLVPGHASAAGSAQVKKSAHQLIALPFCAWRSRSRPYATCWMQSSVAIGRAFGGYSIPISIGLPLSRNSYMVPRR
jgi:hypothetical protein